MKTMSGVILSVGLILSSTLTCAAQAQQPLSAKFTGAYQSSEAFLTRLGFKNYDKLAEQTLKTQPNIHDVSKAVLEGNTKFFGSLSAAKDIASLSYAFLIANSSLPREVREKNIQILIDIAAQQSMAFPLIALEPVQDETYASARGTEAMDIREDYLADRGVQRFEAEKKNLLKAYSYLYSRIETKSEQSMQDFQEYLNEALDKVLMDAYTISEAQQNRYFGKALSAVIVKYARETQQHQLEERLKQQLASVKVNLEDMLNARYRPLTQDKKQEAFQLKNGDIAFEFSNGQEAYFTAMGVKPVKAGDIALAKKYELINTYSNIPLFLSQEYYNQALERQRSNLLLSQEQEKVLADFWNPYISKGYSHAGLVRVMKDSQSGISMAWVMDVFPNAELGRVRLNTLEGFAYPERNIRIGFARYNPAKMLQQLKEQMQTRGYIAEVFETNDSHLQEGLLTVDRQNRYNWPAKVKQAEIIKWMNVSEQQAEDWYQNTLLPRVFNRFDAFITSADALAFADNMVSSRSTAYCSQIIKLAFLQAGNLDIAPVSDVYRTIPKIAAKYAPEKLEIDSREFFISPNGLVWQSQIIEQHVSYNLSRERVEYQTMSKQLVDYYTNYVGRHAEMMATPIVIEPTELDIEKVYIYDDRGS